jgi:predicted membrane protein
MNAAIKLIIGIIILLIGLYWYAAPLFGHFGLANFFSVSTFRAFVTVFAGLFGLLLIGLGVIISWIEYEDLKWESREKAAKKKEAVVEPAKQTKK